MPYMTLNQSCYTFCMHKGALNGILICPRLGLMIATCFVVLLIMKNCKKQKAELKKSVTACTVSKQLSCAYTGSE